MSVLTDEALVRAYLRSLVGRPERIADNLESTEPGFLHSGARWARRNGVDMRTLAGLGVARDVLDRAGIVQPPIEELVRAHYSRRPFDVATLTRRSCVSAGAVRQTLADDERLGRVERVTRPGCATGWRVTRS